MKYTLSALFCLAALSCCGKDTPKNPAEKPDPVPPGKADVRYPVISSSAFPAARENGNIIPDFSRVGYRWGDEQIPTPGVVRTLTPPADGADATALIQDAINNCPAGAILLRKGTFNISGTINLNKSNVVLRGEGNSESGGTVLVATGATQRSLIVMSGSGSRNRTVLNNNSTYDILDDYVPTGQFWVRIQSAATLFAPGDNVVLYRPATAQWISDLKMDCIPQNADNSVVQWSTQPGNYETYAERVVTAVRGDTVHLENPVVMCIDKNYGGGRLLKYNYGTPDRRVSGCGVESLYMKSAYTSDTDEKHGWTAVEVALAEHCWVRNVTARYFGRSTASIERGAKNITVEDCAFLDPKSIITGERRYSFLVASGQLALFRNCTSSDSRHDFITGGAASIGPNVFSRGTATRANSDIGPHQRWNAGTLYDCITSDNEINIQDRSSYGTGHGWAGVTNVLWNCKSKTVIVQNPWVSGYNYSVGTIGTKSAGKFTSPLRPDGVWVSAGTHVEPASLYEAQLALRRTVQPGGVRDVAFLDR